MYDNIRFSLPYPFSNEIDFNDFCSRFCLSVKDEQKGIYHNRGYEDLKQNKGVFIKVQTPKGNRKGTVLFNVSLHKFYNYTFNGKPFNYDNFSFEQANQTGKILKDMFPFDIGKARIKKYEIGINIITSKTPDIYLQELKQMNINTRELRILEDLHYTDYKQYSTNKSKYKRVVYIFYNKTFEVRSKEKEPRKRDKVPNNILRMEKDTTRPTQNICFDMLFSSVFQYKEKQEFKQRFINDLEFNAYPKIKHLKGKEIEIYTQLENKGETWTRQYYKNQYLNGNIKKSWFYDILQKIEKVKAERTNIKTEESEDVKELKMLIKSRLNAI